MIYIWATVLNRDEDKFWDITPRFLFVQIDKHAEFNNPKDSKKKKRKDYDNVEVL